MAKKNVRDDPSKTQVTENPQMSDIVLVLDKMELLIQAVSEINKNGKYSTVPADKEHQNSFERPYTLRSFHDEGGGVRQARSQTGH